VAPLVERVERQRQPAHSLALENRGEIVGDLHAVGADDHPQALGRRVTNDLDDVAAEQRLAAGEDEQTIGGERRDLVDDAQTTVRGEFAAVGERFAVDLGSRARVEVAVLAG
jgi:hypothetical protein